MNNNKILMSLLAASISAMAAAPALANPNSDEKKNIINVSKFDNSTLNAEIKNDLKNQVEIILSKKLPATRIGESVGILIDNYGENDVSIRETIYKELNLGSNQDSVMAPPGAFTSGNSFTARPTETYSSCHSNCHSACHGSRGWR